MDKNSLAKALKSAAWIVLPGALISLFFCMFVLGSNVFEMLLPVWLCAIFAFASLILSRIPVTANRLWIKAVIYMAVLTVSVICLRLFVK